MMRARRRHLRRAGARLGRAPVHPHNAARNTFVATAWLSRRPAPRFSRTQPSPPRSARVSGDDTGEILRKWGVEESSIGKQLAW